MGEGLRAALFILNYNSSGFLQLVYRSVESALNIEYDELDIVIIDNNSTDGSYEALRDRFRGDAIFIKLGSNYGYAGGNELGFRRYALERGFPDYAIFMNNDYVVTNKDSVKEIIRYMEKNEKITTACGYTLAADGRTILDAGSFVDVFYSTIPRLRNFRLNEAPEEMSFISFSSGAFLATKVKPILKIRGAIFEPRIFLYEDEPELTMSLWSYGFYSASLPVDIGIHYSSATVSKYSLMARYFLARNKLVIMNNYWGGRIAVFTKLAKLFYIRRLPLMVLQGRRGAMDLRGFIDSRFLRFSRRGPFYPLLIMPRRAKTIMKIMSPASRRRVLGDYYSEISGLTVTENILRSSPLPYLLPVYF